MKIPDQVRRTFSYHWGWYAASVGFVLLVSAGYLVHRSGSGFPLDDAWIHQCYARTLAQAGQFAFAPGHPSTGSTSLLWTLLLALGYLLRLPPASWTYSLGLLAWLLTAWTAQRLADRLFAEPQAGHRRRVPWVAVACLLEWHLAWAAMSGMEITLFGFLSLLLLERYAARAQPLWLGAIGGLLVVTRPEGLVLAGAVSLAALIERQSPCATPETRTTRFNRLLLLVAGLAAALAPYIAINLSISGQPFPSTLYAKQAEYRVLLDQPVWRRLWIVARRPLVGAQVLLLPGFVWQAYTTLRGLVCATSKLLARSRGQSDRPAGKSQLAPAALLALGWWAAYHGIYALRLPVDYQHGRYLIPALPILIVYGITGTVNGLRWASQGERGQHRIARVSTRSLVGALGTLAVAFLVLGGQAYATDRGIIQREMVDIALWLRDNTPPDALIAAHDIGAIGYYAQRPLLDLAGLINPEVIPLMRDESRLIEYIVDREADYLVTFPTWYPTMVEDDRLSRVYQTLAQDGMAVYQIER